MSLGDRNWSSSGMHLRGTQVPKFVFFVLGSVRVIFRSQVVAGLAFGRYLEPLLGVGS